MTTLTLKIIALIAVLTFIMIKALKKDDAVTEDSKTNQQEQASESKLIKPASDSMTELDDNNYNEFIVNNPSAVVVFYDFQGPSKRMAPLIDECAVNYKDTIAVGLYNLYGICNETVSEKLNIMAAPTFLFYKNGKEIRKHIGFCMPDVIKGWFEELYIN